MDKFILGILVFIVGVFVLPFAGYVLGSLLVVGLIALAAYLIVEMAKTIRRT